MDLGRLPDTLRHMKRGVLLLLLLTAACASPGAYTVRAQAAQDLGCASHDVEVQRLDASGAQARWAARGCGRKADYACHGDVAFGPYVCSLMPDTR